MCKPIFLLLILTASAIMLAHADELDFSNMGSFNHHHQRVTGEQPSVGGNDEHKTSGSTKDQKHRTNEGAAESNRMKNEDPGQRCRDDGSVTTCLTFMKRFLTSLLRQLDSRVTTVDTPSSTITVDIQAQLSQGELQMLKNFVRNTDPQSTLKNLPTVDHILSKSIHIMSQKIDDLPVSSFSNQFLDLFRILGTPKGILMMVILTILGLSIFLMVRLMLAEPSIGRLFSCLFFTFFVLNCVWNYISMVDEVIAKDRASLSQIKDIPKDCNFDNLGFMDAIGYFVRVSQAKYEDRCEQYHKLLLMDPLSKVAPMEAMSMSLAQIFTAPLGYIGTNLSKFLSAFTFPQQVLVTPTMLIVVAVVALLVILSFFGFKLRTPVFSLESGNRAPALEGHGQGQEGARDHVERVEGRGQPRLVNPRPNRPGLFKRRRAIAPL